MVDLILNETEMELTYTSSNGVVITIKKDDSCLDVRQVTPLNISNMTWMELRDLLSGRL